MKKHNLKNLFALTVVSALTLSLAACGTPAPGGDGPSQPEAGQLKIGIIQYAPHPSLDNCTNGFIQGLADAGYKDGENVKIDLQNAQGEGANADMMAKNMVAGGYDMIVGVATPSAMSAYSAARETKIPVVFTAVSDPLAAGIVKAMDAPASGATGTSDALNLDGQLKI
ncbi:MAG: ABC transporter substrate binding protein, partial [Pseudoflavonifractor sp.]